MSLSVLVGVSDFSKESEMTERNDMVYEQDGCKVTFFACANFVSSRFEGPATGEWRKGIWNNAVEWRNIQLRAYRKVLV